MTPTTASRPLAVAIVGMDGVFPEARSVDELWKNLVEGVAAVRPLECSTQDCGGSGYVPVRGVAPDADLFDESYYGMTPREAALTDPQQRVFLECVTRALQRAGYDGDRSDVLVGVFAGAGDSGYFYDHVRPTVELENQGSQLTAELANRVDFLATRVSYRLDLGGPSLTVQTACSSSLVAVHLAWQSLVSHECDLAVAGGTGIPANQQVGYYAHEGGIFSREGVCRAFDANATGTVPGGGAGVVVLRRLDDAIAAGDHVHAVILGSAINNDGARSGFSAPSVTGQASVLREAQDVAGIGPEDIGYVEAHGTGTHLGDAVELAALLKCFKGRSRGCMLGSIKPAIGHLDAAAGIAGLIKSVLALENECVPPTLNYKVAHPDLDDTFRLSASATSWPRGPTPRRAGVSSFGMGGTNAHVVLEEAPSREVTQARLAQVIAWSAASEAAADRQQQDLAQYLLDRPDLPISDVAFTLQAGRKSMPVRRAVVCHSANEAAAMLSEGRHIVSGAAGKARVVFLFPGQGVHDLTVPRELDEEYPLFREALERAAAAVQRSADLDVLSNLRGRSGNGTAASTPNSLATAQLFCLEYALAALWKSWGVEPEAVVGHSAGEIAAACVSGALTLEAAAQLASERGRLIDGTAAGGMLAVAAEPAVIEANLPSGVTVAGILAPDRCTVSGPVLAIEEASKRLQDAGFATRRIETTRAFHSASMDPAVPHLEQVAATLNPCLPQIPWISSVDGRPVEGERALDPRYWGKQLRQTVRLWTALENLGHGDEVILLEVGPVQLAGSRTPTGGRVLGSLAHRSGTASDLSAALNAAAFLWSRGVDVDWAALRGPAKTFRVPLPTYPFDKRRHWIAPSSASPPPPVKEVNGRTPLDDRSAVEQELIAIWREALGVESVHVADNFFDLGGSSLVAVQIVARVEERLGVTVSMASLLDAPTVAGLASQMTGLESRPTELDHLEALISQIEAAGTDG